ITIADLAIVHGRATGTTVVGPFGPVTLGGGILNVGAQVTLSDVSLRNNQVVGVGTIAAGGGIANVFSATLAVTHSTFTANRATGAGGRAGAITNDGGSNLMVAHSTFTRNQAT